MRIALIVGIDAYREDMFNNLRGAIRDASEISGFLKYKLPMEYRFEVVFLSNPSAFDVEKALDAILPKLDENSTFLFYFAGHGMRCGKTAGQLLLCSDATRRTAEGISLTGGIMPDILADFSRKGRGDMVFCYDVCRSPALARGSDTGGVAAFRKSIASTKSGANAVSGARWTLSSCKDGQLAGDEGAFAKSLLEEMDVSLKSDKGIVFDEDFVARITMRLENSLNSTNQTPTSSYRTARLVPAFKNENRPESQQLASYADENETKTEMRSISSQNVETTAVSWSLIKVKKNMFETRDQWRRRLNSESRIILGSVKLDNYNVYTETFSLQIELFSPIKDYLKKIDFADASMKIVSDLARSLYERTRKLDLTGKLRITDENEIVFEDFAFETYGYSYSFEPPRNTWFDCEAGERKLLTIHGAQYGFCWAPPGTFQMGSSISEWEAAGITGKSYDEYLHEVTLTQGFWMLESQVTQALYESVTEKNPSKMKGRNLPVEQISWNDCQSFIKKLNAEKLVPKGWEFALPTEAQWEYACRAGSTGNYGGNDDLDEMGWYDLNSDNETHEVKTKSANAWGLYDMHGNVWELCADAYASNFYQRSNKEDPLNNEIRGRRVLRGGSWGNSAEFCRSAFRSNFDIWYRFSGFGLRLVLVFNSK